MPTPEQIVQVFAAIANDARPVAMVWHVVALAVFAALPLGCRPSRRVAAIGLVLPLLTASGVG